MGGTGASSSSSVRPTALRCTGFNLFIPMRLSDLTNGQVVRYRLGRAGQTCVQWGGWQNGSIYVARREKAFRNHPTGEIVTLTPNDQGWAEYSERDFFNGCFTAEDYYMEIEGLTP